MVGWLYYVDVMCYVYAYVCVFMCYVFAYVCFLCVMCLLMCVCLHVMYSSEGEMQDIKRKKYSSLYKSK